jgi:hypothetical protein
MNDSLAERLLAEIMDWNETRLTQERQDLQSLSSLKYDEYQQFYPGIRFMESLCLWLKQFPNMTERENAYDFVKKKLVFVSNSELNHIIRMAYPDIIEPYLVQKFSEYNAGTDRHRISSIVSSDKFKILKRRCVYLALSDGARMDILRRFAKLDHEQVFTTYLLSNEKIEDFAKKLGRYYKNKSMNTKPEDLHFKIAFLVDDFSASGTSFARKENGDYDGKIVRFIRHISGQKKAAEGKSGSPVLDISDLKVCVVLYVATSKALNQIRDLLKVIPDCKDLDCSVFAVHELDDSMKLHEGNLEKGFYEMLEKYYDDGIETESYKKGKMEKPFLGFDEGGWPLVLPHNCPNNSLPILWFGEKYQYHGLFPRVERFPSD